MNTGGRILPLQEKEHGYWREDLTTAGEGTWILEGGSYHCWRRNMNTGGRILPLLEKEHEYWREDLTTAREGT